MLVVPSSLAGTVPDMAVPTDLHTAQQQLLFKHSSSLSHSPWEWDVLGWEEGERCGEIKQTKSTVLLRETK